MGDNANASFQRDCSARIPIPGYLKRKRNRSTMERVSVESCKKGGEVTELWLKYQLENPFPPPIVKVNNDVGLGVVSLKL